MGEGAGTVRGPGTATVPLGPARSHPRHGRQGTKQCQSCGALASLQRAGEAVPIEVLRVAGPRCLRSSPSNPIPSQLIPSHILSALQHHG